MMDVDNELLEKFIASRPAMKEHDRTHIRMCVKILGDEHISMPVVSDYETVKNEVLLPEIMKLPKVHSKKTADSYITSFNKYNNWLIEHQKGEKEMSLPLEYDGYEENTSYMATEEKASEVSTVSDSENIETISDISEVKDSKSVLDIHDTQATETCEHIDSMQATESIKNSENVSDIENRKKASKKGNREQISLYIDREIYANLKRIAKIENTTVTDIICRICSSFVKKNTDRLCKIEEMLRSMKEFEY